MLPYVRQCACSVVAVGLTHEQDRLPRALIIGYRTEATDAKVPLNEILRDHGASIA